MLLPMDAASIGDAAVTQAGITPVLASEFPADVSEEYLDRGAARGDAIRTSDSANIDQR